LAATAAPEPAVANCPPIAWMAVSEAPAALAALAVTRPPLVKELE